MIGRMNKSLETLASGALTPDKLVELGLLEKDDTGYKPKAVAAPKEPKQPARPEDDPVIQRVKTLEQELANEKKAKAEVQQQSEASERDRAVIAALNKAGAVNADRDVVHVAGKVLKGDKGYYVKAQDKYGADIQLPLDEAVELFLKANTELRKNAAAPGSGTPPGGGAPGTGPRPGQTVIPKSQWADMAWFSINQAKFHSGEYVRGQ